MARTRTSTTVKDRYNRKAYDDLRIRIPKGQKAVVQRAAEKVGETVNAYTQTALLQRMGLEDWPPIDEAEE